MMKILQKYKVTPNQVYVLWSLREGELAKDTVLIGEIGMLKINGFLVPNKGKWSLSILATDLLNEVDNCFKKTKSPQVKIDPQMDSMILKYLELWDGVKPGSGKKAKSNPRNLKVNFIWFFKNYKYSWETILLATELYLNEQLVQNFKFTRTSQYFISKSINNQARESELANYCQRIIDGDINTESSNFSENIFE